MSFSEAGIWVPKNLLLETSDALALAHLEFDATRHKEQLMTSYRTKLW
jgi:hypothetical protein